ncbi:L-threonylcarbamoyladenylate synthase, partial [Tractidigestivibacter sp.]|uniref:L-threonylcarbamoyladenylate synthase n=1 Tax=Tractidigestivibacter sp. TaxID=2847320 RepID=UPI003FD6DAD4
MGRVMQVSQDNPTPEALDAATKALEAGGVIVSPTDSVYGLVCAATPHNPAHQRIFEIKNRPATQTLPLFVADPEDLPRYAASVPAWAHALVGSFWPGALTLVVTATDALPAEYLAPTGTVALRCPNSALVRELARRVGALAQTSANTHGEPSATSGASVEPQIVDAVDL